MPFFPTTDEEFQYFRDQGYTGSLNDMIYAGLGSLGYTGALSDRIRAYVVSELGDYHEGLKAYRNGTSVFALNAYLAYAANDLTPQLIADFSTETYAKDTTETTFSDLITHSRTSNATMVDADGLLKWAPHNLLPYSEDFSNAAWAKTNATIASNVAVSPDGGITADKLIADATNTEHKTSSNFTLSSDGTFAVFAKPDGYDWILLQHGGGFAWFDVANGAVGTQSGVTGSISLSENGFYRCQLDSDAAVGPNAFIWVSSANGVTSFLGDGTSGVLIYGAHLYRSDLGGMVNNPDAAVGLETYVPTTTAAVYSPRRGNHVYNGSAWVNEGLLHESAAATNLAPYSDLSVGWTATRVIITTDATVSPDGGTNATLAAATSVLNDHTYQGILTATVSQPVIFSAFVKAAGVPNTVFRIIDDPANTGGLTSSYTITVSLTNGEILDFSQSGGTSIAPVGYVEDCGNGWYRVSVGMTKSAGNARTDVQIYTTTGSSYTGRSFLGDDVSGIYIYGAQLEASSVPTSYIPTAGATATRAAETLTVPIANVPYPAPVEVTGTELVTNGTFDTDVSGWSVFGGSLASVSGQLVLTEDEVQSYSNAYQAITTEAGKVYAITLSLISVNGPFKAQLWAGTSQGNASMLNLDPISTGVDQTFYFIASGTSAVIQLVHNNAGGTGDNTVWDNISVKEINPLAVSIQMDGLMTYADTATSAEVEPFRWFGGQYIKVELSTTGIFTGKMVFLQYDGATASGSSEGGSGSYSPGLNVPFSIASRHGSTFINGAVDGTALTASLTPTAFPNLSATNVQIGYKFTGNIGKFRMWGDTTGDIGDIGIAEASA